MGSHSLVENEELVDRCSPSCRSPKRKLQCRTKGKPGRIYRRRISSQCKVPSKGKSLKQRRASSTRCKCCTPCKQCKPQLKPCTNINAFLNFLNEYKQKYGKRRVFSVITKEAACAWRNMTCAQRAKYNARRRKETVWMRNRFAKYKDGNSTGKKLSIHFLYNSGTPKPQTMANIARLNDFLLTAFTCPSCL